MISGRLPEKLFLDPDRVDLVLREAGQTLENVANDWVVAGDYENRDLPPAPGRSTIHDWIRNGFPSFRRIGSRNRINEKYYQILAFCGLIDVDPFSVFDLERNHFSSRFAVIRSAIYGGPAILGPYAPLFELFEPDREWPSDVLAKRFWRRAWQSFTFSNELEYKSQDYALIKVAFRNRCGRLPRAVHMAYRRWDTRDIDPMWRFYGSVIAIEDRLELISEGGVHQIMRRPSDIDLCFRTFFGGRKVEFKITSLHEFDKDIVFPFNDMTVIGFNW